MGPPQKLCRLVHLNQLWEKWSWVMGREQGLRGFPGKLHPVMESPLDQRLQGDQDCDRTQQDPCLA